MIIQTPPTVKLFCCDLNWTKFDTPVAANPAATAADWSQVDAQEYFDWHVDFGNNLMFMQAYLFGGTALYPSKLGPIAPGAGAELLPRLFALSRAARMPFMSYFCVGTDLTVAAHRPHWVAPSGGQETHGLFLAPESPWTELLRARIAEFLADYPVEWLLFDWFVYGGLKPNEFQVQPAWFAREPFREIIGRPMPESADDITPAENLQYKREILARQFHAIQRTVRAVSPNTNVMFNVPYWQPEESIWVDHPMMNESDCLFAECSREDVVDWLLRVRRPQQRVMTTIIGRPDGECEPDSWRRWHAKGLDFFGYAWGTPPDFRPHASYRDDVEIVRNAFHCIG